MVSANVEIANYKDDFEALSTGDTASSSSNTLTREGSGVEDTSPKAKAAEDPYGFALSPIHTSDLHTSSVSDSKFHSSLFTAIKLADDTESESPVKPKSRMGSLDKSDGVKLLKSRSSLLNIDPSLPMNSKLTPELTESSNSSHTDIAQHKFTPLAPIPSDHLVASDSIRADPIPEGVERSPQVLEPLKTMEMPPKIDLVDSNRPVEQTVKWQDSKTPNLSSMGSDDPLLVKSGNGAPGSSQVGSGKLTQIPFTSSFQNIASAETVVDSLTVVTEVPNSSLGDMEGELTDLQSTLVRSGLPQIPITQPSPPVTSQSSTESIINEMSPGNSPSHETTVAEKPDHLAGDPTHYSDLNIQEIIRAITGEELACITKEILESSPPKKVDLSPSSHVAKGARKLKSNAPTGVKLGDRTKPKRTQNSMAKQKTKLSSSRESLASQASKKSDLSFRKQTTGVIARSKNKRGIAHSKNETGKEKSAPSSQLTTKKPEPFQRTSQLGNKRGEHTIKTKSNQKPALQDPHHPKYYYLSANQEESNPWSGIETDSNSDYFESSQRPVKFEEMAATYAKEVSAVYYHCTQQLLIIILL